jgi:hypothetical protein
MSSSATRWAGGRRARTCSRMASPTTRPWPPNRRGGGAAFEAGLDRVRKGAETHVIALMCAEQEPLDCHRCLLVSRRLRASSLPVAHILSDGRIEAHQDTERRLLVCEGLDHDDIFESPAERLDRAYRQRAGKVAFAESASDAAALGTAG